MTKVDLKQMYLPTLTKTSLYCCCLTSFSQVHCVSFLTAIMPTFYIKSIVNLVSGDAWRGIGYLYNDNNYQFIMSWYDDIQLAVT